MSNKETDNQCNIHYSSNDNNGIYWLVKQENNLFDIRPSNNDVIENFTGNIKRYGQKKWSKQYLPLCLDENLIFSKKNISISENPFENNYFQSHKMSYDLNIDFSGKVTANVYYPDENKGGYNFKLTEDDFNLLKGIIDNLSIDNISQKYFINDNYCSQAIVINDKYILNDYNKMKLDIDVQAIIMFSNLITMKYIAKQKGTNNVYKIRSSEYTKIYKPEPL